MYKYTKRKIGILFGMVLLLSYVSTHNWLHIDLALYGYMIGTLFFCIGFLYRYMMWKERPATKAILKKGFNGIRRFESVKITKEHLGTFRFIQERGMYRWIQHVLVAWGCVLAGVVTFPLIFGWMYFTMNINGIYTVVLFGINIMSISANGALAFLFFNALNISAMMVLLGVCMMIYRRLTNMQARAEQSIQYDFIPLFMLLAISLSGLLLTISNVFLDGWGHFPVSVLHQWLVIVTMLYAPFGKLNHVQIRPLSVVAKNYRNHYGNEQKRECALCHEPYVSVMQSEDVKSVLIEYEMNFQQEEGFHLAELCLNCRRKYRIGQFAKKGTHHIFGKEMNQHAQGSIYKTNTK